MTEKNRMNEQALENVNGGCIYLGDRGWEIIDDRNGNTIEVYAPATGFQAEARAKKLGQSGEEIDYATLKALRESVNYAVPVGN